MKYTFFIVGLLLITFSIKPNTDTESSQKSNKTIYVLKKNDPGVWNSNPVKVFRYIGYYFLLFNGCLCSLDVVAGPFLDPKYSVKNFGEFLLETLLSFGLAHLIRVNNEDSETTQIIATEEGNQDNIIIIKQ